MIIKASMHRRTGFVYVSAGRPNVAAISGRGWCDVGCDAGHVYRYIFKSNASNSCVFIMIVLSYL